MVDGLYTLSPKGTTRLSTTVCNGEQRLLFDDHLANVEKEETAAKEGELLVLVEKLKPS